MRRGHRDQLSPAPGGGAPAKPIRAAAALRLALRAILPRAELRRAVLWPFFIQRILLFTTVGLVVQQLPISEGWRALPHLPPLDAWLRWDSSFYLLIAYEGYGPSQWGDPATFYPFYPALIRLAATFVSIPIAALLVANLAALIAIWLVYELVRQVESEALARRSVWIALLFPTSFFLSAGYAESTYLAATLAAFLCYRRDWQLLAAATVMIGVLTRPVGAFCLTLPFLVDWLVCRRTRRPPWFVLAVLPAVLLLFVVHHLASGDPLAFLSSPTALALGGNVHVERPEWWRIILDEGWSPQLLRRLLNWGAVALSLVAGAAMLRRRSLDLALVTWLSVGIPLLFHRGLFDAASMGRYALMAFPIFMVLARWCETGLRGRAFDFLAAALQISLAVLFATWRWAE